MTTFVQLLGTAKANLESVSVPFISDKRYLLLAFLAFKHDWVSRDQLANLFWADTDSVSARKNLRHLLSRTRNLDFVRLEGQDDVRWLVETDVALFQQHLGTGNWERAIAVYQGHLLAGLSTDSSEFEDWLQQESEVLQNAYREAALNHAKQLEQQERFEDAGALLGRVLKADLLAEDMVQAYLRVAGKSGAHRLEALRVFEAFKSLLRQELGLEPLEITKQLALALKLEPSVSSSSGAVSTSGTAPSNTTDVLVAQTQSTPTLRNFPMQATPFVGRDVDLSEIAGYFKQPEIRLLTLIGAGGMGKTRLSIQVALEQAKHFSDGAVFVPLASVASGANIVPAIASALGFVFSSTEPQETQLQKHLANKQLLLVLDNLEHLLSGTGIILELMETCPNLRFLTTSREALDFQGEYLVDVFGLDVPKDASSDHIEVYDSVQLFLRSAKRVNPRFNLERDAKTSVVEICQMLQGSPLGIELASNWLRVLSVQEVALEVQKSLDFLTLNQPNIPARHRSIRAVFEHSWMLLTQDEQTALKRLSVFAGSFRKEAAEQICSINLRTLLTLTNKSLLRRTQSGRFERHALVQEFSLEKLQEDAQLFENQQAQHGVYFFDFLEARPMGGSLDQQYLKEIEEDLENIRTAWDWAVRNARADQLGRSADLVVFFDRKARCEEGVRLFQAAIDVLDAEKVSAQAALGKACFDAAWLGQLLGRYEYAKQLTTRAVELLRPLEDQVGTWLMKALSTLATIEEHMGDNLKALQNFGEALVLAKKLNNQNTLANYLNNIGAIESNLGLMEQAELHYLEALEVYERTNQYFGSVLLYNNLGLLKSDLKQFSESKKYFDVGLELAYKIGFFQAISYFFNNLGNLAFKTKDYDTARGLCLEAFVANEKQSNATVKATSMMLLGRISTATTNVSEAIRYFHESLEIVWSIQELPIVMQNLVGLGELHIKLGNTYQACKFLHIVNHHPSTDASSRREAKLLLEQLPDLQQPLEFDLDLELRNAIMGILENPVVS